MKTEESSRESSLESSVSPTLEAKIATMLNSFDAIKAAVDTIKTAVDNSERASKDLGAALIQENSAERNNFEAEINRIKEDAKNELDAAIIKAKEDAIKEMDAEILKSKLDVQKELESLKQLSAVLSKQSQGQVSNKAISESNMSVTTYVSPSQATQPSEGECAISFQTICDELLRHTKNYLRSLNVEYRVDINAVSNMVKSHRILYSFLFETTEFGKSDAQEVLTALGKEGTTIAPASVLAVKKAFRLLGEGQFFLEYRALARFLASCDAGLQEIKAQVGYVGDDELLNLIKTALERQRMASGILHNWEFKPGKSGELPTVKEEQRKVFEKTCPKECLNGLRTLKPQNYPIDMFTTARKEVGLCCRCKDCRKGLGIE